MNPHGLPLLFALMLAAVCCGLGLTALIFAALSWWDRVTSSAVRPDDQPGPSEGTGLW